MKENKISEVGQMMNELHSRILDRMLDELEEMGYDIEVGLLWDDEKQMGGVAFFSGNPSEEEANVVMELYQKYLAIAEYID